MKFEIHETVQTPDPEMVLRALEMCSREVSSDVVRYGDRITVRGLGPSPRSKNKHDMTVFCVNAEDNKTVIQGEVNFQASALLGESSQQEVVRSKLDDLFEQMKAQIQLDSLRVATYAAARKSASSTKAVVDRPEEFSEIEPSNLRPEEEKVTAAPETLTEAMAAMPDSGWGAAALVAEPQEPAAIYQNAEHRYRYFAEPADNLAPSEPRRPDANDGPESSVAGAEPDASDPPREVKQILAEEEAVDPMPSVGSDVAEEPTWAPYRLQLEEDHTSGWKRFVLWTAAAAILLSLAGGAYLFYQSRRGTSPTSASATLKSTPAPANTSTRPVPPKDLEASPVKTNTPSDPVEGASVNSAELKLWLRSWAASLQTRDANAQAAFYADKLDRYLDQRNVGRGAVLRDREATIHMRKGLWTVKIEDIVIERQTASEAEVRLMKHFIDEPEQSEILESFIPTRLTLKRINGQWKITSEQDQPIISVSPWKAQGDALRDQDRLGAGETQPGALCADVCAS